MNIQNKLFLNIIKIHEEVNAVLMGHVTQTQFMEFYFPEQVSYEIDPFGFFYYKKETPTPTLYTLIPVIGAALIIIFCNKKIFIYKFLLI